MSDKFLKNLFPSDGEIKDLNARLEAIFEIYSNCNDTEEDGTDLNEMYGEENGDDEEDLLGGFSECEDVNLSDDEEITMEELIAMPEKKKLERFSYQFSAEFIENFKKSYEKRVEELSKLNLPFWQSERTTIEESLCEDTVETPVIKRTTKMFRRNTDIQRHTGGFATPQMNFDPFATQMNVDRLRVNGTPLSSLQANMAIPSSTVPPTMPLQIQQLLQAKVKFTMKIREREYDIEVEAGQQGNLMDLLQIEAPSDRRCKEIENSTAFVSPMKRPGQFESENSKKPRCGRKILPSPEKKIERHLKSAVLPTPAKQLQEIESSINISHLKRQAPHANKKLKKPRRRGLSSSSDEDCAPQPCITHQASYIQSNTSHGMSLLQPMSQLTLDDISCGPSCSTVTSDDEKSFVNPAMFDKLRERKRQQHKQEKLLKRTAAESMLFVSSKFDDSDCFIVSGEEAKMQSSDREIKSSKKGNDHKANDSDSSDDFYLRIEPKIKLEDTKALLAKSPANVSKPPQGKSIKEGDIKKTVSSSSDDSFYKKPEKEKLRKKKLKTSKERFALHQQRPSVGKENKKT